MSRSICIVDVRRLFARLRLSCGGYLVVMLLGLLLIAFGALIGLATNTALRVARCKQTQRRHRLLVSGFVHRPVWRTATESIAGLLVVLGAAVLTA